jgi:glyoxylase I family protein
MDTLSAFHHVALTVTDLDASIDWYRSILGFEEVFREEGEQRKACVLRLPASECSIGLVEHRADHGSFDPRRTGLDHLAFTVATREALNGWADRLTASGVKHSDAVDVPPGAILNFKDPDGIALALFWDRS